MGSIYDAIHTLSQRFEERLDAFERKFENFEQCIQNNEKEVTENKNEIIQIKVQVDWLTKENKELKQSLLLFVLWQIATMTFEGAYRHLLYQSMSNELLFVGTTLYLKRKKKNYPLYVFRYCITAFCVSFTPSLVVRINLLGSTKKAYLKKGNTIDRRRVEAPFVKYSVITLIQKV